MTGGSWAAVLLFLARLGRFARSGAVDECDRLGGGGARGKEARPGQEEGGVAGRGGETAAFDLDRGAASAFEVGNGEKWGRLGFGSEPVGGYRVECRKLLNCP